MKTLTQINITKTGKNGYKFTLENFKDEWTKEEKYVITNHCGFGVFSSKSLKEVKSFFETL